MAEVTLTPDPQLLPPGTVAKVYPAPATVGTLSGQPPGELVEEPTVSSAGQLVVKGLTEGREYVAWSHRGGQDYYLHFRVSLFSSGSGGSGVASVNGKTGAVELGASDVGAIGTASPAFTGTPTAPTANPGTNSTQLATTAFADAAASAAVATETSAREGAITTEATARAAGDAEALKKAHNLEDLTNQATARGNLGLGTAATQASTAFDAAGAGASAAATAQAAAEAAAMPRLGKHATVSGSGATLTSGVLTPANAESEALALKLPAAAANGTPLAVEKTDATTNEVVVEGLIRSESGAKLALKYQHQTVVFICFENQWWPLASHLPLTAVKEAARTVVRRSLTVPAGQAPGNEVLLDEYVKILSGEKRRILWVSVHTTSGTIKVALKHGEGGTTVLTGYGELEATSEPKLTSSTVELADKDRLTITTSGGATPKGLYITWGEEVVAP